MNVEASWPAAEICAAIAQEVQALKSAGYQEPNENIASLMSQLCTAPALDAVDALAFAAIARKLLASAVGGYNHDELTEMGQEQLTCLCAFTFLHRAVETLEVETGLSAEGFTGEAETIN